MNKKYNDEAIENLLFATIERAAKDYAKCSIEAHNFENEFGEAEIIKKLDELESVDLTSLDQDQIEHNLSEQSRLRSLYKHYIKSKKMIKECKDYILKIAPYINGMSKIEVESTFIKKLDISVARSNYDWKQLKKEFKWNE